MSEPTHEQLLDLYNNLREQIEYSHNHFEVKGQKVAHVFWMHSGIRRKLIEVVKDSVPGTTFSWETENAEKHPIDREE